MFYDASRKLILKGVDGVVFVADSQIERMEANIESLENLRLNLTEQGYDLDKLPYVVQYNKRDLPNAAPLDQLRDGPEPDQGPRVRGLRDQRRRRVRHAQGRRQGRPDRAQARQLSGTRPARRSRGPRREGPARRKPRFARPHALSDDLRMTAVASRAATPAWAASQTRSRKSGTKRTSTVPVTAANSSAPATPKPKPASAGRSARDAVEQHGQRQRQRRRCRRSGLPTPRPSAPADVR